MSSKSESWMGKNRETAGRQSPRKLNDDKPSAPPAVVFQYDNVRQGQLASAKSVSTARE